MLQGTGSDVGKSVLVAGLCRVFKNRGLNVLPFKPQNMSNNAAATAEGGEIGRAQWLQAIAAGAEPHTDMNPVLIKPESDKGAQLVVQGKVKGPIDSGYYRTHKAELLDMVRASYNRLCAQADLVLVEGAGSPAEVNLRAGDIANMGFALPTKTPVVLVGDINRGGVIAAIVGTHALLPPEEQALVRGTIINQFRGDVSLFDGGLKAIEEQSGWANFGVVPFLRVVRELPAEDAVVLETSERDANGKKKVAVPMLPSIANFDDLDPLAADPDIEVQFCPPGTPLPQAADLIVLPGSKSTIRDLRFLKAEGWATDILAHARADKPVLGLCGGYQMLGKLVHDPGGIEGPAGEEAGLGLLDVETVLEPVKSVQLTAAHCSALKCNVSGYEIHMGQTTLGSGAKEFISGDGRTLGAVSADGKIVGTYVHGLLYAGEFRATYIKAALNLKGARVNHLDRINTNLDTVAHALETCLDVEALWRAAETSHE